MHMYNLFVTDEKQSKYTLGICIRSGLAPSNIEKRSFKTLSTEWLNILLYMDEYSENNIIIHLIHLSVSYNTFATALVQVFSVNIACFV